MSSSLTASAEYTRPWCNWQHDWFQFNSVWLTNFVADSHGVLEFQFDMTWRKPDAAADDPGALAETLQADPQVIINPGLREHPIFMDRLHRP